MKIAKEDLLFFGGELNQASKTAQVLKDTVDSLDEIERLFTEGVTEAEGDPNGWMRKIKDAERESQRVMPEGPFANSAGSASYI